jgi:hypothetical protein
VFKDWSDKEIAEEAWAEYWQELQADDEALRLWQEAQTRDEEINREIDEAIEQGECEALF